MSDLEEKFRLFYDGADTDDFSWRAIAADFAEDHANKLLFGIKGSEVASIIRWQVSLERRPWSTNNGKYSWCVIPVNNNTAVAKSAIPKFIFRLTGGYMNEYTYSDASLYLVEKKFIIAVNKYYNSKMERKRETLPDWFIHYNEWKEYEKASK